MPFQWNNNCMKRTKTPFLFRWLRLHGVIVSIFEFLWTEMNANRNDKLLQRTQFLHKRNNFFRLNAMHCRRVARMACLAMDFRRHFNFSMVFVCWARGESVCGTHTCTWRIRHSCTVVYSSQCRQVRVLRAPSKSFRWIVNGVRLIDKSLLWTALIATNYSRDSASTRFWRNNSKWKQKIRGYHKVI